MTRRFALTIAACMVATITGASAVEIPKEYRGPWCGTSDGKGPSFRPTGRHCPASSGDDAIGVDANGYAIEDMYCTATEVRSLGRGRGHLISFHCEFNPGSEATDKNAGDSSLVWRLEGKRLWIK
jgi:hypothetical protein